MNANLITAIADAGILLVDDESEFLETLMKRMRKRGITVNGAETADAAFVFLAANPTDVVVLDFKMPGVNGIDTLTTIKHRWPHTEVIMLTGHACLEAAIQGMEAGAFDYLTKPIDIDELIFKIEDAYDKITINRKISGIGAAADRGDR